MNEPFTIKPIETLRKTKDVLFSSVPMMDNLEGITRVMHEPGALSPGSVGDVKRPWYMHQNQEDNLLVMHGHRVVELYTKEYGRIVKFEVYPEKIIQDGEVVYEGAAVLHWPTNVFHRIESGADGSKSLNFAVRYDGFDIRTNFNIYEVDTETGDFQVAREGHKDQPEGGK
jgi:hypothetical protein